MRLKIFTLLTLALANLQFPVFAQIRSDIFKDNYSSDRGWTQINTGVSVLGGKVIAEKVRGYQIPKRIHKTLPTSIHNADNWKLELILWTSLQARSIQFMT